ncbi:hypothetical protein R1sor_015493 [Riccia sorocarpa]|uniref:Uncharacterized protein n=1 Tax=Riccia sorocarpa TaxID=122646 RepID=A0ABD3HGA7_9MARC
MAIFWAVYTAVLTATRNPANGQKETRYGGCQICRTAAVRTAVETYWIFVAELPEICLFLLIFTYLSRKSFSPTLNQTAARRFRPSRKDSRSFPLDTAMPDVTGGDAFYQTARAGEDCGPEMGNQTGRSAVDVETNAVRTPQQNRVPQQSRGDASVQSVDDVRSSGKTVRSKDRPPPPERKTSLISAYKELVKEKLVMKKEAQYQKASFRDAILEDRRQAREQRERARIQDGIEAMRRARADRRSTLLAEMVKTGKSMDEIHQ